MSENFKNKSSLGLTEIQIDLTDIFLALSHMPVLLSMAFWSGCEEINRHCLARPQKQPTKETSCFLKLSFSTKKLTHTQKEDHKNIPRSQVQKYLSILNSSFLFRLVVMKVRQKAEVNSRS